MNQNVWKSSTPHDKTVGQQPATSSDYSSMACFEDVILNNVSESSDEEEDQNDAPSKHAEVETQIQGKRSENKEDAARIADEKRKIHREKIKKMEEQMKKRAIQTRWGTSSFHTIGSTT